MRLGIIGAGKLGMTVARLAIDAGIEVVISGSGDVDRLAWTVRLLAPGVRAATTAAVAESADVVVLALPFHRFHTLDRGLLDGRIVIDAMNYWEPVDGADRAPAGGDSSATVQQWFPKARVVKTLNQLGYHALKAAWVATERVAQGVAGDDPAARTTVMALLDRLGFDSVDAGPLAAGVNLVPGSPAFGAASDASTLSSLLRAGATGAGSTAAIWPDRSLS
ncbi:NADP oxidoreductase [Micromonospora zingiberis]|uniref:NADP oxidoreductase n=2 Tax=Micromonospora zingiberis TaxID=2053011 RepID=A0A4R0G230_9ACTN|nr:NADP oxidoreductase [Micromonospora zingiberis]